MNDDLRIVLYMLVRVAAWVACLALLFQYYRFAGRSMMGFRGALSIFFRRLALILPAAVVLWLVCYVAIDSEETYFLVDALFPLVIALSAVTVARRAVNRRRTPRAA